MEQITVRGGRARVPAINSGSGATDSRLERHLGVLAGPAVPQQDAEDATRLMRELTTRDPERRPSLAARGARVLLLAPLRRLRRTLFGDRGSDAPAS